MKAKAPRAALRAHRRNLKRKGERRVEVRVHKDDVALIRKIAEALTDPGRKTDARVVLRSHFGAASADDLKAYLAAAPLEGINLTRQRDFGRDVDL